MGKTILFWLSKPDGNLPDDTWGDFHDLIAVVCLISIVVSVFVIWLLYRNAVQHLLIRRAPDPFGPYTPMLWLLLSIVPGVVVSVFAWYRYGQQFPDSNSFAGGAAVVGLYAMAWTLVLGYIVILAATPVKFKYRPRLWV
jgi:hypothetical protein